MRQMHLFGFHYFEHLQRANQSISGRAVITEDNMPALFPTEVVAIAQHLIDHVFVTDRRPNYFASGRVDRRFYPGVAHDRRDEGFVMQIPSREEIDSTD